jgi:pimeloyl-ACP methyl ester carboxylesterase
MKNYAPAVEATTTTYKTLAVDGLNVAYREAGRTGSPKLVLLHGFPSSSHQYRNLIPTLADRFHVISPDYPGFGGSDAPDPAKFAYTFDKLAESSNTSSSRRASIASVFMRRTTGGQLVFAS